MGGRRLSGSGQKERDWVEILVAPLLIGAFGVLLTAWFSWQQDQRQTATEERSAAVDRQIEEQRAQDAALESYLDQMAQLVLEEDLHNQNPDEDEPFLYDTGRGDIVYTKAGTLARARTLATLDRVDPRRKRVVLQTLYESALIGRVSPLEQDFVEPVVALEDADAWFVGAGKAAASENFLR